MPDFAHLLEEQIPRMRRYAVALTRNRDRADDLVQATLVRAIAKQHLFKPDTNLRAWLFTLLHNQHVNEVRRATKWGNPVQIDDVSGGLAAAADTSASHGSSRGDSDHFVERGKQKLGRVGMSVSSARTDYSLSPDFSL